MITGAPENKRLQPVMVDRDLTEAVVRQHKQQARALHHYTPIDRLGLPRGVRCWCGATLVFSYREADLHKKRKAFFDQHDECEPEATA